MACGWVYADSLNWLEVFAGHITTSPYIIQDTDLFSTVGYWQFPHWQSTIGACPSQLVDDTRSLKSDLYIVTKSNIPFETDPLRYGGDTREGSDDYWLDICKSYFLPYIVLETNDRAERLEQALEAILATVHTKARALAYDRHDL